MRKVLIIGIGAGNPEHVTVQAINALNRADVLFVTDKGERADDLVALRRDVCERYITEDSYRVVSIPDPVRATDVAYEEAVRDWHGRRAEIYQRLISTELGEDGCGAFLVWGDPSFYDSTLRIINGILERTPEAFEVEVVPGISAVQALAAAHATPLHGIGEPVLITTGRRLAEGLPADVENVVVLLDGGTALRTVDAEQFSIHWGAYLGTEDELLRSGPLDQVVDEIERTRSTAKERKGWMFDTYLLRRRRPKDSPS